MKRLLLFAIILCFFQSFAFADEQDKKVPIGGDSEAGEVSSGGGSAIVCRDANGVITQSPQVLDLYESQFTLPVPTGVLVYDYVRAVRRSYELMGFKKTPLSNEAIEKQMFSFLQLVEFTESNEYLVLLDDVGVEPTNLPQGCAREQAAIFFDNTDERSDFVVFDTEIWQAMDSLNKAALITHETIYKDERVLGEVDSQATRKSVAYIYATEKIESALNGVPAQNMVCTTKMMVDSRPVFSKSNAFHVYEKDNGTVLQFTKLMGRTMLAKSTVLWPGTFNLQKGDPSGLNLHDELVVWEKGVDKLIRIPLEGSQFDNLVLELEYKYNKSFKISLYRKGKLLERAETSSCIRKN